MSRLSLEYSMHAYGDSEVTPESISDLIVTMCMQHCDYEWGDSLTACASSLVNALDHLRAQEQDDERDDDQPHASTPTFRGAVEVEDEFNRLYAQVCKSAGQYCDTECSAWVDGWPTDCWWHKTELLRLARLVAGRDEHVRRQLRAEFLKHEGGK